MSDPLAEAEEALERGDLVVFPTDTVYGLAARPDRAEALFRVKRRSEDLAIPILVASTGEARGLAVFNEHAELLVAGWPGPITLVLPRAEPSMAWRLGGSGETVGVRMPKHPLALALLARTGPLAVTSANRSGAAPLQDGESIASEFGDAVAVYLCEEAPLVGLASTVVDLTTPEAAVVRVGAVTEAAIARFLAGEEPLLDSRPSP